MRHQPLPVAAHGKWARYSFSGQGSPGLDRLSRLKRYPRQGTASGVLKLREHPRAPTLIGGDQLQEISGKQG